MHIFQLNNFEMFKDQETSLLLFLKSLLLFIKSYVFKELYVLFRGLSLLSVYCVVN